jgi:diguanylate cyclase (GGDEF)-like protein/PAS domain S-box-containing protein
VTISSAEQDRLKELRSYCILDTVSESDFDNITKLIAKICDTPIATVTLVDQDREWYKSAIGLNERENEREIAFCAQAIQLDGIFVVPNALEDPIFSKNPMVLGHPHIRFYAGVPLISPNGHALGTLAVKDYRPRELSALQLESLKILADQVMVQLELRRKNLNFEQLYHQYEQINQKITLQSEHLEKEREFLSALLENLSEGIVACDDQGKLSLFNNATRALHGLYEEGIPPEQWAEHYDLYKADGKTHMPLDQIPLFRAYRGEKVHEEELVIAPKKQTQKIVVCNGQPLLRADGKKLGAVVAMRDITEQKAKETALAKSEAKLSAIFNQSYLFQGLMDADGTVIEINDIALDACGYKRHEEIGKKFWDASWWSLDLNISTYVREVVVKGQNGEVVHAATDYHVASGERRQTEFVLTPIRDENRKVTYILASGQDVTDRRKSEIELARMNRSLRLLGSINELLIRTKAESNLLTELCKLIVSVGGYQMAWVGYAYDDPEKSIKPIAHFGNFSHLKNIKLSWSEDVAIGKGPAARTIRSGQAQIVEDILQDSGFKPWADSANKNGYRGVICLPLIHNNKVFGLVAMYSNEVIQVIDSEIKLLQELADDLAFGIMNIRAQEESQRFYAALYKMASSVSASIDEEFFLQLTKNMTEAIGADAGFIAQLVSDAPLMAKTLAAVLDGKKIENMGYEVSKSPCRHLLDTENFILSESISECFNPSETMISMGMKDYVGQRLINSKGEVIGMLFVMMRETEKHTDIVLSLMKVFAARAGAELERLNSDQYIREQAALLDKAQDAIMVRGLDNKVQFWNSGAERLYGWTRQEAIGSSIETLLYPDITHFNNAMEKLLIDGEWSGEIEQQSKFYEKLMIESHWTLVRDEKGKPKSVFTINTNITERKAATDKIQYLAFYDPLTKLPNRTLLLEKLKQALAFCEKSHHYGALLLIDLDNFKALNDTLGHDIGDLLLNQISERLKSCVSEKDNLARFGGDEFVVLLEDVGSEETEAVMSTTKVANKILNNLNHQYLLEDYEHHSTASIGITLFSKQEDSLKELLKRADLAMYKAKAKGRNAISFFDPQMQSEISLRVSLESDLRQSLSKREFLLHYQPQINYKGQVVGAEALLRWQHPERGMVSPAEFIPIAEETRMILPIGNWVLESACEKLVDWSARTETSELILAVNVSKCQFRQPDFVEKVLETVNRAKANPRRLKLELTESLFAENVEDIIDKMHKLKEAGISFSLDDFGTGYSSLSYLKQMPLDQLKIDQSFVRDIMIDPNDASIAQTIISLAQSLNLEVIAEGVETEDQKYFLHKNGCNFYQGYLFSKPLPNELFDAYLEKMLAT